jgi:hypothetical protein
MVQNGYKLYRSFFYSEIPKKFGLSTLTHSEVIALLLILTKFTCNLTEVHHR